MYMDFAKNFDLRPAHEIQSAYWDCTSVTIHRAVCFYHCTRRECNKVVTDKFMQITKEKKYDSFIPRLVVEQTIECLVAKRVPLLVLVQVCDNASAQYKCSRAFSGIARCPVPVIRAYFGEKHGKSFCDGFFGSHKQLMKYYIHKKSETGSLPAIAVTDAESFQHVSETLFGQEHHNKSLHTAVFYSY